jgi:hypothetical protein
MLKLNEAVWDCHFRTICRVTRHRISTSIHEHGTPVETKPALVICAQEAFQANQGHKLYSKVLAIEPNRLLIFMLITTGLITRNT